MKKGMEGVMKVLLVVSNVVLCAIALRLAILDAIASSKAARAKHADGAAGNGSDDGEG